MEKTGHHDDGDICRALHGGADTSAAAHSSGTDEGRLAMRTRLLGFIRSRGAEGATADEIEHALEFPHQSASARISEMLRDGAIHDSGRRRKTHQGRAARVYLLGAPPEPAPSAAPMVQASILTGRGDARPAPSPSPWKPEREVI